MGMMFTGGHEETSGVMVVFIILITVMIPYVKNYQIVHLAYVKLIVCQLQHKSVKIKFKIPLVWIFD